MVKIMDIKIDLKVNDTVRVLTDRPLAFDKGNMARVVHLALYDQGYLLDFNNPHNAKVYGDGIFGVGKAIELEKLEGDQALPPPDFDYNFVTIDELMQKRTQKTLRDK